MSRLAVEQPTKRVVTVIGRSSIRWCLHDITETPDHGEHLELASEQGGHPSAGQARQCRTSHALHAHPARQGDVSPGSATRSRKHDPGIAGDV